MNLPCIPCRPSFLILSISRTIQEHEAVSNKCINKRRSNKITIPNSTMIGKRRHRMRQTLKAKTCVLGKARKLEEIIFDHLERITILKTQIQLSSEHIRPVHSATCRAGSAVRKLAKNEMDRVSRKDIIKLVTTKKASSILFNCIAHGSPNFV